MNVEKPTKKTILIVILFLICSYFIYDHFYGFPRPIMNPKKLEGIKIAYSADDSLTLKDFWNKGREHMMLAISEVDFYTQSTNTKVWSINDIIEAIGVDEYDLYLANTVSYSDIEDALLTSQSDKLLGGSLSLHYLNNETLSGFSSAGAQSIMGELNDGPLLNQSLYSDPNAQYKL